jgi:hypothetical protein
MTQKLTNKEYSIKQLRSQLEYLTSELNKTTEKIQLLEISDISNPDNISIELEPEQEISELIKKQNVISHEIITVKRRIQKLSAKTILKAELLILPVVIVLLFFVATNYSIQPIEQTPAIKTHYVVEDLQGNIVNNYNHWSAYSSTLIVNIKNSANVDDQKIQGIKNAIISTDRITGDGSLLYNTQTKTKTEYFRGWQGAVNTISANTKYPIPEKFNLIQSNTGEGDILVTLSTVKSSDVYSGVTRTIVNGNQILKAFITIYDSNKLTDNQLESMVRQEFGHALGLPSTDNSQDLMNESIITSHSYITECDLNALQGLYNDIPPSGNFCNN